VRREDGAVSHGAMNWFGVNLARNPFSAHAYWFGVIPYLALVAVGLQFLQLTQMRRNNPVAAQMNP
jgi:hypothetical protein